MLPSGTSGVVPIIRRVSPRWRDTIRLKYEEGWMNDDEDPSEARHRIEHYRETYAYQRPCQAFGYRTTADYSMDEQQDESLR